MTEQAILWFDALSKASTPIAGRKGANLGEMTRAGIPVPPGIVITAAAFVFALEAAGIRAEKRKIEKHEPCDYANRSSRAAVRMASTAGWTRRRSAEIA